MMSKATYRLEVFEHEGEHLLRVGNLLIDRLDTFGQLGSEARIVIVRDGVEILSEEVCAYGSQASLFVIEDLDDVLAQGARVVDRICANWLRVGDKVLVTCEALPRGLEEQIKHNFLILQARRRLERESARVLREFEDAITAGVNAYIDSDGRQVTLGPILRFDRSGA